MKKVFSKRSEAIQFAEQVNGKTGREAAHILKLSAATIYNRVKKIRELYPAINIKLKMSDAAFKSSKTRKATKSNSQTEYRVVYFNDLTLQIHKNSLSTVTIDGNSNIHILKP